MERFSIKERLEQKLKGKLVKERKFYKIAKRSDKRIVEDRALKKMFLERFVINPYCELKSPVCTGLAECQDHLQKTSPNNRLKPENLKMVCFMCNSWKETAKGQEWCAKNGFHISRFKK